MQTIIGTAYRGANVIDAATHAIELNKAAQMLGMAALRASLFTLKRINSLQVFKNQLHLSYICEHNQVYRKSFIKAITRHYYRYKYRI